MTTTDITVYIDDKPYRFHVKVDEQNESTTYSVDPVTDTHPDPDFIPGHLEFNYNGSLTLKEKLKTVEQEQIARLIWQEILDKMNP
ncbi:hypothetical protein DVR12_07900 [Chitinophaga silvatica]|uniref:Uncharacterized protein n=1 Tax=Chitinophaga silvatica TaxID=2282649 RepID=A0A3E1YEZ8_9BACT|nr:hypothetical protein [Chitinophaga silvatica]RFS25098.1 hypothetical protein DVR12_07900 [Chitinophaga silvatica]